MDNPFDRGDFDERKAELILCFIAGGRTLQAICEQDRMPSEFAVARWLICNPEFKARYFEAREIAMELVADELLGWSRTGVETDFIALRRSPTLAEITQARRTRVAVKQWLMAKWAPKTYAGRMAAGDERSDAAAAHAEASPALSPPPDRGPAAPPRISPRPFTIPPIANGKPINIPGLAMPQVAGLPHSDLAVPDDTGPAAAPPSDLGPRPPRRERRAMAAMERKQRAHPSAIRSAPDCNPPPI